MPMTEAIAIEGAQVDGSHHDPESFVDTADQLFCTSSTSKFSNISVASPPDATSFMEITESPDKVVRPRKPCTLSDISLLPGETICTISQESILHGDVYFTNYRVLFMLEDKTGIAVIPRVALEYVQVEGDDTIITVICRNGRLFRISTGNPDRARAIHKRLLVMAAEARSPASLFAFQVAQSVTDATPSWLRGGPVLGITFDELQKEFDRLQFTSYWKISSANTGFNLIETYPEHLIVPESITDQSLATAVAGRFLGRIPSAVWRDVKSGATLFRSSQPVISWFGPTNSDEVDLYDKCRQCTGDNASMIIMDARSSTSAHANRVKGGGFESANVYIGADVKFMNLPNIHAVRDSFARFRQIISVKELDMFYFQNVHNCNWLYQVYNIILSAKQCVEYLVDSGENVLVHCSDGWDRTTQIVSLAKLMGDAYYRTTEGFELLIRGDWIGFGHKFNDRNAIFNHPSTENEKSPIFLQWLDCVFQLWTANPTAFQFNANYLVKIAQHCYSGLFGTFLFNSLKEHNDFLKAINCKALPSLWSFLNHYSDRFQNVYYDSNQSSRLKVPPMRNLKVWEAVYNPNRFEEPLNSTNDGIAPNFSDLVHSSFVESFYPENSNRAGAISRSHSEENVSSSVGKTTTIGGPQTFCYSSQEGFGQRRRSASQVDATSISSMDATLKVDELPQPSTSTDPNEPSLQTPSSSQDSTEVVDEANTSSAETISDRDQNSSISSEGDQSEPEASSSGTCSRNSVIHRSRKFRLRFGKEKVVDADGLTSIINIENDNVQRIMSTYEKRILELQAQIEKLKHCHTLKANDDKRPSEDGDEQCVLKTDDEFEMVNANLEDDNENVSRFDAADPVSLDGVGVAGVHQSEDLHGVQDGFQRLKRCGVRRSTTGSDRSSLSGCSAAALSSDFMDQMNFEGLHAAGIHSSSENRSQLVPISLDSGSVLRHRQPSTSSTASFNFLPNGQTVHG
ncbi:hypothetical protein QR680_013526 [Steinernema hermaphroditum]|uniref:Myotubularin phosphatase domain-containing protein n=1 Tax=Steinernema hermaphroditum TaxID=289476 RepID=A0AA39M2N9_9BILA|nr:hypothetical protein QR680_013526 [Steinernema hermaphroditum]